jgi:lipopolysaccharide biosynthesis regulator YciM
LGLFLQVASQSARYVPEVLPGLMQALDALGRTDLIQVLESLAERQPSGPVVLALSDALLRERGPAAATATLTGYLARNVDLAALERLLDLQARQAVTAGGEDAERAGVMHEVVHHLLVRQPAYQCDHCGFSARAMHWQCPSCKRWGSVQPVLPERIPGSEVLHERRVA